MITREQMIAVARDIVKKWESIDADVEDFLRRNTFSDDSEMKLRSVLQKAYRDAVGGQDVYDMAKMVVKEFGE